MPLPARNRFSRFRSLNSFLGLLLFWAGVAGAAAEPKVTLIRVPSGGLQPQAVVDSQGAVHLVYLKGDPKACDVFYSKRDPGQKEFSPAFRVNSVPGSAIAIGTVRGAQIALGRSGRVHVAWNGSDAARTSPGAGDPMLYARMNEAGNAFEPQRNLMTTTTHLDGGGSVAADAQGHVYVVWHGHRKTGPQEEIDRGVFLALSSDDGRNFAAERQVNPADTGVCGCCGLKAAADSTGALAILYRSANLKGNRDSVLLVSSDFGKTFITSVLGNWHISTCPMSTHALVPTTAGIEALWENAGQIQFGRIHEPESGFSSQSAEGATGNRKHPTFAQSTPSSPMIVAWTEGTGWEKGGALAWECLDSQGHVIETGRVDGVPVWSYAAAVAEPAGAFSLIY